MILLFTLLLAAPAPAPVPAPPPAPLRTPDAVLADYTTALGGPAGWKKHKALRMKREVEIKGMQIRGTEERWATAASKTLVVTTIPGMGTFRQGSNGRKHWAEDPINGLRVLAGAEEEQAQIDAAWGGELTLKKLYRSIRSVQPPAPPPEGKRYECLELTGKAIKPAVTCFDAETHLRVLQKGTHSTPQGEVPYTVKLGDWKEVEGVKIAHYQELAAGPMVIEGKLVEVKFGETLEPKKFEIPKAPAGKN